MKIFSSFVLVIGLLSLCFTLVESIRYPDEVQPLPFRYTQIGRTEIAQKACAIPGPRGYRGPRGPAGDMGATGPAGLPGILGSQVELLDVSYITGAVNISITPYDVIDPSTPGYTPYGVLVSRPGFPVTVLLTVVVNVQFTCDVSHSGTCLFAGITSGESPIYLEATVAFTQVAANLNGGSSAVTTSAITQSTIYLPVNYAALQVGGATGNVLVQLYQLIDASDTSMYYASVSLAKESSSSAPSAGYNYYVSGNMIASIYYGTQLFPSPSPIIPDTI